MGASLEANGDIRPFAVCLSIVALLALVRFGYGLTLPTGYDAGLAACEILFSAFLLLVSTLPFLGRVRPLVTLLRVIAILIIAKIGMFATFFEIYWSGRANPLADELLAQVDAGLGLDWRVYVAWFDARPRLLAPLLAAYRSVWWQVPTIGVLLALCAQQRRVYVLAAAKSVSLFAVSCLTWRFPAYGAYTYFRMSARTLPHLLDGDLGHMKGPLDHLRAGIFDPADSHVALVQFPSFHTAAAIMLMWAAWRTPLRWPFVALNLAMLAATPVFGSHYFSDMLAGAVVGTGTIVLIEALVDFALGSRSRWGGMLAPEIRVVPNQGR